MTPSRWLRPDAALLLVPTVLAAVVVLDPSFAPNPDAFYHFGVARAYLTEGWLHGFAWLPYTTLAEGFPNAHLGQHVLLLPLAATADPDVGIQAAILLFGALLALALYVLLRRLEVPAAALWVTLGLTASASTWVQFHFLKGNASFLLVMLAVIEALWANAPRRAFAFSWLSVYTYVGAPVLLPMAIVFGLIGQLAGEKRAWRLPLAVAGGLLAGLVVNPFWPDHWSYVARELASVVERSDDLTPGEMRGGEWVSLHGRQVLSLAGAPLAAWGILLVRHLARPSAGSWRVAAGCAVSLGLFGGGLLAGPKLLHLFALSTIVFLPPLVVALRPWPRWTVGAALAAAVVASSISVGWIHRELLQPGAGRAVEYAAMAEWLDDRVPADQVVLAPWDDFPGLFAHSRAHRYVAGINPQFLRDHDPERFAAYRDLYRGASSTPADLLDRRFDGAAYVLVSRPPRTPGHAALSRQLRTSPDFEELPSPAPRWRVFHRLQNEARPTGR